MNHFNWPPCATLKDRNGNTTDAATANALPPARFLHPDAPLISLPAFFNALKTGQSPAFGSRHNIPDQPSTFFTMTGGTTGAPKLIRRTVASWAHSISVLHAKLSLSSNSRAACLGDLSHSLTLYACVEALTAGAQMHLCNGSDLAKRRITHLYATPTQLRILRQGAASLRYLIVGGGPMDGATTTHLQTLFPNAQILRFYGAAETSFITLADQTTPPHSVGPAFPGAEIEIRDEQGKPAKHGSVWVRSPMFFEGYAKGTATHTKWDGDWLTVGENGTMDDAGNLTLSGRIDRILTIADQSVNLDEIEADLLNAGANAAAVIARPDLLRGHTLHGFTTAQIAKHPHLKTQMRLSNIPTLPSGKIDYPALQRLLQ